jgi:hypothetical protein
MGSRLVTRLPSCRRRWWREEFKEVLPSTAVSRAAPWCGGEEEKRRRAYICTYMFTTKKGEVTPKKRIEKGKFCRENPELIRGNNKET